MTRALLTVAALCVLAAPLGAAEPAPLISPYLPADTKVIVRLSLDNLIASRQFKEKDLQPLHDQWYRRNFAADLSSDTPGSPLRKVRTMTAAFPAAGDSRAFAVIHGMLDTKLLLEHARASKSISEAGKEGDTVIFKQKVDSTGDAVLGNFLKVEVPDALWFAVLDEKDWVFSTRGKEDVARAIRIKAGKDKAGLDEAMMKLIETTVFKQDSLTMLMIGHELPKNVAEQLPRETLRPFKQCKTLTAHARYGETVTVIMEYTAKTPQDAAEAEKLFKENVEGVRRNFLAPLQPAVAAYDLIVATQGKDKVPDALHDSVAQFKMVTMVLAGLRVRRTGNRVRVESSAPAARAASLFEPFLPKPETKPRPR